jgi:hypothetical protein
MRLALVPPSNLTSERLPLYEDLKAGISAKYVAFTTMRNGIVLLWRVLGSSLPVDFVAAMDGPYRMMVLSAVGMYRRVMVSETLAS